MHFLISGLLITLYLCGVISLVKRAHMKNVKAAKTPKKSEKIPTTSS